MQANETSLHIVTKDVLNILLLHSHWSVSLTSDVLQVNIAVNQVSHIHKVTTQTLSSADASLAISFHVK